MSDDPIEELVKLSAEDDEKKESKKTEPTFVIDSETDNVLKADLGGEVEVGFVRVDGDREYTGRSGKVEYRPELGYTLTLWLRRRIGKRIESFPLELTAFSVDELECLKQTFIEAVDYAVPHAAEADRKAIVKFHRSQISNKRLFRGIPSLSRNDGTISTYMSGLRFRPEAIQEVLAEEPTD